MTLESSVIKVDMGSDYPSVINAGSLKDGMESLRGCWYPTESMPTHDIMGKPINLDRFQQQQDATGRWYFLTNIVITPGRVAFHTAVPGEKLKWFEVELEALVYAQQILTDPAIAKRRGGYGVPVIYNNSTPGTITLPLRKP